MPTSLPSSALGHWLLAKVRHGCLIWCVLGALGSTMAAEPARWSVPRIPVIYSTDLFHPHDDPDDHFDLATLFALPELDVQAILLDQGDRQLTRPGRVVLEQMFALTGRPAPYASGLAAKLASPDDDGRRQPPQFQAAIGLLLQVLREAAAPVTVIATGSARDVCAAFNREPNLCRQKIARLYLNMGNADDGGEEWNVQLDPQAFVGLMRSGLPIYWCPCFPIQRGATNLVYSSFWKFRQAEVLETAPRPLQNFFIYALQTVVPAELHPTNALAMDLRPWRHLVWKMDRNMWCTASLLHAAGRQVHRTDNQWSCARRPPPRAEPATLFTFIPARVEVDDHGKTRTQTAAASPNVHVLKLVAPGEYGPALRDCLKELCTQFPPKPSVE